MNTVLYKMLIGAICIGIFVAFVSVLQFLLELVPDRYNSIVALSMVLLGIVPCICYIVGEFVVIVKQILRSEK